MNAKLDFTHSLKPELLADCVAYLAPADFTAQMAAELSSVLYQQGRLYLARKRPDGQAQTSYWAQNIWLKPELIRFSSISDAARQLKARQRNWVSYQTQLFRRAELIQQQLPRVSTKPLPFPVPALPTTLGSWMLIDEQHMLASTLCSSPFAHGEPNFLEDKVNPPSRAYLKLYEALTVLGVLPKPGERCLELGAAPGGWTWVLRQLGAQVTALDRAELAPELMRDPEVLFVQGDAFAAKPERFAPIDWLVSDIICYPEKLYDFLQAWLAAGHCRNFICTLKFQGDEHYAVIPRFAAIPGSRIMHLSHNKHELTWALLR